MTKKGFMAGLLGMVGFVVPHNCSLILYKFNMFKKSKLLKYYVIVLFRKKCTNMIHRGYIIGDNVLFNLLNKLMERGKMRGLSSILALFLCNEFNKFNNTGARMLNFICHMALKPLRIAFLA